MKHWNLKLPAALFVLASFVTVTALKAQDATPAPAQNGPGFGQRQPPVEKMLGPSGMHSRFWNNPDIVQRLNLTDDQRKAMDAVFEKHKPELTDLHDKVEAAEDQLKPLMNADKPEQDKVLDQIDKLANARKDLEKANARFLLEVREKLTPDQWKQLRAMREERRANGWHGHYGNPMPPPPPPPPPPAQPGPGGPMAGPQFDPPTPDAGLAQPISSPTVTRILELFDSEDSI